MADAGERGQKVMQATHLDLDAAQF